MSLTTDEQTRVETEAAAIGADSGKIAAAVTRLTAIKTAAEAPGASSDAVNLWELWKRQGAAIERIDSAAAVLLTQADPYAGAV